MSKIINMNLLAALEDAYLELLVAGALKKDIARELYYVDAIAQAKQWTEKETIEFFSKKAKEIT